MGRTIMTRNHAGRWCNGSTPPPVGGDPGSNPVASARESASDTVCGFQFDGYYNGDKTLLTPDVLIDDRPVTLEAMAAKGVTVLHPGHRYCRDAPGRMFHRWAAVPLILGGAR